MTIERARCTIVGRSIFASFLLLLTWPAIIHGQAWTGPGGTAPAPTSGNWSVGGVGGNWGGAVAPASGAGVALTFSHTANSAAYTATNDNAGAFNLTNITLNNTRPGITDTLTGSEIEFVNAPPAGPATALVNSGSQDFSIKNKITVTNPTAFTQNGSNRVFFSGSDIVLNAALTFDGTGSGAFFQNLNSGSRYTGAGAITISGGAADGSGPKLGLNGVNTFAGGVTLTTGRLLLQNSSNAPATDPFTSGPIGTGTLTLNGAVAGNGDISARLTWAGNSTLRNAVSLGGGVRFGDNDAGGFPQLTFSGTTTLTANSTISVDRYRTVTFSDITRAAAAPAATITKRGVGTAKLGKDSTLKNLGGFIQLADGRLINDGDIGEALARLTNITVGDPTDPTTAGVLGGGGSIFVDPTPVTGQVQVLAQGTLSPGDEDFPDILTVDGGVHMSAGAALAMSLNGTTAGEGPGFYSKLNVVGEVGLDGMLDVSLLDGFLPAHSDVFNIVSGNVVSGHFDNADPGAGSIGHLTTSQGTFDVFYSANSVSLGNFVAVPEPALCGLSGVVLACLGLFRFRREK